MAVPTSAAPAAPAAPPTTTPIKHLVVLMQDNHSFDNYFGTYPGANGIPGNTCMPVRIDRPHVQCIKPFHLGDTPLEDLALGPGIQKRQFNGGRMDGFVAAYRRLGQDGTSVMGYYDDRDIPYYWNVADRYVLFDNFFASTAVGSRESFLYWTAGGVPPGRAPRTSSSGYDQLPTIFDRLADKDVSARFYVENLDARATSPGGARYQRPGQQVKVPLLSMRRFRDDGALPGRVVDLSQYYTDLRTNNLPAVSYIVTSGSSENPPASPQAGAEVVRKLTSELVKSDHWDSSAFLWTYDGWGGWYDHVPPGRIDGRQLGFRVPALLMSPYAREGFVDHSVLDYTAVLAFIIENWRLEPLAGIDGAAASVASGFDFAAPARPAELLPPTRQVTSAVPTRPAAVIYIFYGLALAAVTALLLIVRSPVIEARLRQALVRPELARRLAGGLAARWTVPERAARRWLTELRRRQGGTRREGEPPSGGEATVGDQPSNSAPSPSEGRPGTAGREDGPL